MDEFNIIEKQFLSHQIKGSTRSK